MSARPSRSAAIAVGGALVAAAIAVAVLVPSDEQQTAPFVGTIPALGTTVQAREFELAVTDVRLAHRVQTPEWIGQTNGIWLVVDIEFAPRLATSGIDGMLRIGDREYLPTRRADAASVDGGAIGDPGLPWAGSLLVELPQAALTAPGAEAAVVQFATGDTRLDGVLEYTFDLSPIDVEDSITVFEPERIAP